MLIGVYYFFITNFYVVFISEHKLIGFMLVFIVKYTRYFTKKRTRTKLSNDSLDIDQNSSNTERLNQQSPKNQMLGKQEYT